MRLRQADADGFPNSIHERLLPLEFSLCVPVIIFIKKLYHGKSPDDNQKISGLW